MDKEYLQQFMPEDDLLIGVDFGKQRDHSAIVALRRHYVPKGEAYNHDRIVPAKNLMRAFYGLKDEITEARVNVAYEYQVIDVQRLPLGVGYAEQTKLIVAYVKSVIEKTGLSPALVCDKTGCGDSIADNLVRELREARVYRELTLFCPIYIKSSGAYTKNTHSGYNVSVEDLVYNAAVLLQRGRIKYSDRIPLINVTVEELNTFKIKKNRRTGNDVYEAWGEGAHDDTVFGLILPIWVGEAFYSYPGCVHLRGHVIADAPIFGAGHDLKLGV